MKFTVEKRDDGIQITKRHDNGTVAASVFVPWDSAQEVAASIFATTQIKAWEIIKKQLDKSVGLKNDTPPKINLDPDVWGKLE